MSLRKVNIFNLLDNQSTQILVNPLLDFSYFSPHLLLLFCLDPFMSLDEASELDYWSLSPRRGTSRRATNFRPTTAISNIHLPSYAQQQKQLVRSVRCKLAILLPAVSGYLIPPESALPPSYVCLFLESLTLLPPQPGHSTLSTQGQLPFHSRYICFPSTTFNDISICPSPSQPS
jgi:hypothetical protein